MPKRRETWFSKVLVSVLRHTCILEFNCFNRACYIRRQFRSLGTTGKCLVRSILPVCSMHVEMLHYFQNAILNNISYATDFGSTDYL